MNRREKKFPEGRLPSAVAKSCSWRCAGVSSSQQLLAAQQAHLYYMPARFISKSQVFNGQTFPSLFPEAHK